MTCCLYMGCKDVIFCKITVYSDDKIFYIYWYVQDFIHILRNAVVHYFVIYNSNIHDIHFLHIGHQHNKAILFCGCEDDAVTLLKLQLWPGSITRPLVAFHFKLVMLAESLLLECHVSLKKFCDMLGLNTSTMLPKWVCISLEGLVLKPFLFFSFFSQFLASLWYPHSIFQQKTFNILFTYLLFYDFVPIIYSVTIFHGMQEAYLQTYCTWAIMYLCLVG